MTNCQIGVFATYVSAKGHAFVGRALYLPMSWTADPARLATAHVPEGTGFATKPALAVKMTERAVAADMPFAWVAADAVYGRSRSICSSVSQNRSFIEVSSQSLNQIAPSNREIKHLERFLT